MTKLKLPLQLFTALIVFTFLATQTTAGKKNNKKTDRGATEKTITGKVTLKEDRHKFTKSYRIGGLTVGRSVKEKVEEFDGKTVTAECRIHKGVIVQIHKIEEAQKKPKEKKKKK